MPSAEKRAESARISPFSDKYTKIPAGHKAVLRFLAESTAESGYLEKDAIEMMMEKYPMKKSTAARILAQFQALEALRCGGKKFAGVSAHSAEAEKRLCSFHEDHKEIIWMSWRKTAFPISRRQKRFPWND